ncbi:MAG: GntR family transcriptional regulator [Bacillota bacterium]
MNELKAIAQEMHPRSIAARDWVFLTLRAAIVRNVLPGGMPLKQDEVSAALSVSHIPVREAFRQLEAQGLVRIYPNRGAVVTQLTRTEIENIMDARIILELGAMRAAMPHLSEETLSRAKDLIDEHAEEKDCNRMEEKNLKFHFLLYEQANNPVLLQLIDQLHANVDRYIRPFYSREELYSKTREQHAELLRACMDKDQELATAVLRTHLETTKVLLLNSPGMLETARER